MTARKRCPRSGALSAMESQGWARRVARDNRSPTAVHGTRVVRVRRRDARRVPPADAFGRVAEHAPCGTRVMMSARRAAGLGPMMLRERSRHLTKRGERYDRYDRVASVRPLVESTRSLSRTSLDPVGTPLEESMRASRWVTRSMTPRLASFGRRGRRTGLDPRISQAAQCDAPRSFGTRPARPFSLVYSRSVNSRRSASTMLLRCHGSPQNPPRARSPFAHTALSGDTRDTPNGGNATRSTCPISHIQRNTYTASVAIVISRLRSGQSIIVVSA